MEIVEAVFNMLFAAAPFIPVIFVPAAAFMVVLLAVGLIRMVVKRYNV